MHFTTRLRSAWLALRRADVGAIDPAGPLRENEGHDVDDLFWVPSPLLRSRRTHVSRRGASGQPLRASSWKNRAVWLSAGKNVSMASSATVTSTGVPKVAIVLNRASSHCEVGASRRP
jgi:hypothetical protein